MLTNWFTGKSAAPVEEAATPQNTASSQRRTLLESDPIQHKELSAEERAIESQEEHKRKLRESALEKPANPNSMFAYDNALRGPQRILMEGHHDSAEGLNLNVSRNVHNTMVSTKWQLGNPQASNWELSLQMQGFSDVISASYSSLSRWQLMYQKTFASGGLIVAQMMAQPQMMAMGGPAGSFFGLIQYPWVTGGCSALQYVKSQQVAFSHMQRVLRGLHVGAQMTYDINTKGTSMSYAFHSQSSDRAMTWAGEVKPESGEWKVACTKADWGNDVEVCAQLEYTEKRNGLVSLMSLGLKRNLIGGGHMSAVLAGFSKIRAAFEFPFGGERTGFNQVNFGYNLQYDIASGGLKQGVTITY